MLTYQRYADGNFTEALEFYSKAIETTDAKEELSMLYSNRSATYLYNFFVMYSLHL